MYKVFIRKGNIGYGYQYLPTYAQAVHYAHRMEQAGYTATIFGMDQDGI
jgi:hypothetical protein